MGLHNSDLRRFLREYDQKEERRRTLNVNESVHSFYKSVATNFDISIATLVNNILVDWKETHQEEIREEIMKKLNF